MPVSKWEAECVLGDVARATAMPVTVLRLPLMYGPRAKANVARLTEAIARGMPLPLARIDNRRSLLGAGNFASALEALLSAAAPAPRTVATFFVADTVPVSTPEFARAIAAALVSPHGSCRCPRGSSGWLRMRRARRRHSSGWPVRWWSTPALSALHSAGSRRTRWQRNWASWRAPGTWHRRRLYNRHSFTFKVAMSTRPSGRRADELRTVQFTRGFTRHAEGSVLVAMGDTHVLCTASVEESVPSFLKGKGQGWLTAEYGMLPRATNTRMRREAAEGKQSGRTQEIQRLIGRSLRAVVDLAALGERTLKIDCDVLQADGGTRCASITGACVAVADAIAWCKAKGLIAGAPLRDHVAAVSVGVVDGAVVLDLDYAEDSNCDTDMNVVMTGAGGFVELQGTAEGAPFSRAEMDALVALAQDGIARLVAAQRVALRS